MVRESPDYTGYTQEVRKLDIEHKNRFKAELVNLQGEELQEKFNVIQAEAREKFRAAYQRFVSHN